MIIHKFVQNYTNLKVFWIYVSYGIIHSILCFVIPAYSLKGIVNENGNQQFINAGLKDIYIRDSKDEYRHINVQDLIDNDDISRKIKICL